MLDGHVRLDGRVVVFIAVHGPELVGELAQLKRQVLIGAGGIGPDRVATRSRRQYRPQDRSLRVGIDERHVGVPGIGPAGTVEFEQVTGAIAHRHGRVGNRLAQQVGKGFLALIIQVVLLAQEQHLVLHQRSLDSLDDGSVELGAKLYSTNLGANAAGDGMNIECVNVGFNSACGIAHGSTLIGSFTDGKPAKRLTIYMILSSNKYSRASLTE
ncbi:hypothetical protein D3C80_557590 [compost metagenome]